MTTEDLAQLLATHIWLTLFVITALTLLAARVLWFALETYSDRADALLLRYLTGERFSQWLGTQVLLSVATALISCIVFIGIVDDIGADEELGRFDISLSAALSRHASAEQLRVFATLTHLGDRMFLTLLVIGVALLLWRRRGYILASVWLIATATGGLLNSILKAVFARSRPEYLHELVTAQGWSFPSGHSSSAVIVYGLLGYLAVLHTPKLFHWPAAAAAMTLIVCIGFSRVVLQVHYFSDVLGGYAFGAAWVAAWIAGFELQRHRHTRKHHNELAT